jgi:hypothetical protein
MISSGLIGKTFIRPMRHFAQGVGLQGLGVRHLLLEDLPNKSGSPIDVMFLPYDSIDCIMQHLAAARAVERLGLTTRVVIPRRIIDRMESRPSLKRSAADQPLNYDDRIFQLNEWAQGSADIARGFVDEYRRTCDVDAFFDVRPLERFIALRLFGAQEVAEACVNNAAVLVLPDLAYAFNRSISAFSRDANRQLFILNPHGRFRQVDLRGDFAYEEPWLATHSWPEGSIDLRRVQPLADRFVEARRVNGGQRDWNLRLAEIEDSRVKSSHNHGAVVFMHCIRDAEQVPLRFNEQEWIYAPDLFCWTRSITRIASENPASWSLRPHPASRHYEGEAAILGRLFSEAGLIEKLGGSGPSRASVLSNRLPVLTHSGTIALECAAEGFKSFTTSSLLPETLAVRLGAPGNPFVALGRAFEDIASVSHDNSALARLLLWRLYSPDLPEPLWLSKPALPQATRLGFARDQWHSLHAARTLYFQKAAIHSWMQVAQAISE